MDLEPLPPEDTPPAPPPGWSPGPQDTPWATADTTPKAPRFSRPAKIAAGAIAVATVGAASWAAGTAVHSGHATLRFQPAAAGGSATTTPGSGSATPGPGMRHREFAGLGAGGTVSGTPGASSFVVTTRGRPDANGNPTTRTVTVHVTSSTKYAQVKSSTGPVTGLAAGTRIAAKGTRNADGSLQATAVWATPAKTNDTVTPPAKPTPPPRTAQAPFVFGTVTADSSAGRLTVSTPWGTQTVVTGSTTTVEQLVPATYSNVVAGARVAVRGQRDQSSTTSAPSVTAAEVVVVPAGTTTPGPFGFGGGPERRMWDGPGGPGRRMWGGPGGPEAPATPAPGAPSTPAA